MNRSAIKPDLFADQEHKSKIDSLGDPLVDIEKHIDFMALAAKVDLVSPRVASPKGGRPAYPTETMVRVLVLKRLYNLSDEAMEYQLLDRNTQPHELQAFLWSCRLSHDSRPHHHLDF